MSFPDDLLDSDVTVWRRETADEWGNRTWGSPVAARGKWAERAEQFLDSSGEIQVSRAVVLVSVAVSPGDYILEGASTVTDPHNAAGASLIRQVQRATVPDSGEIVRRALL